MPKDARRERKPGPGAPNDSTARAGRVEREDRATKATSRETPSGSRSRKTGETVLWLVLGLLLVYVSFGFWPVIPVEGDETAIANGAARLAMAPAMDKDSLYRYHVQPLPYLAMALGERALGIEPLMTFGVLTLVGFASFLVSGSLLGTRLTGAAVPAAGIVLLLFQETYASAYYPNTSMIALGLLAPAAVLLTRPELWRGAVAGILFSLAITARFDTALMGPALVLVAFAFRRDRVVQFLALVATAGLCLAIWKYLFGVSLESIRSEVASHKTLCTDLPWAIRNYFSVFNPLLCVLGLVGIGLCLVQRRWRIVLVVLAGTLPLVLAYGSSITTPKYLLLAIPFVAIAVIIALQSIGKIPSLRWRTSAILALAAAIFLQYFSGLVSPSPVEDLKQSRGRVIWTADFYRLRDTFVLAPLMWSTAKSYGEAQLTKCDEELGRFVADRSSGDILAATGGFWLSKNTLEYELRKAGFRPREEKQRPSGGAGSSGNSSWKSHEYSSAAGKILQVYHMDEQEAGNRSMEAFLAHQRQVQQVPAANRGARPYSFFLYLWGMDRGFLNTPWQFQRVDCDLNESAKPGQMKAAQGGEGLDKAQ